MVERKVLLAILISIAVAASGLVLYYLSLPRAVGTITGTVTQVGGGPP